MTQALATSELVSQEALVVQKILYKAAKRTGEAMDRQWLVVSKKYVYREVVFRARVR